jgi:hypothetical protein
MSVYRAELAGSSELEHWDEFVDLSCNGTLFHLRRFLAYHGDRFAGREAYVVVRKGEQAIAQIAYALDANDGERAARSPYGGSYGGLVVKRALSYDESQNVVAALLEYLSRNGIARLAVTPPLPCCQEMPSDTTTFAMLERGFTCTNRDISSILPLQGAKSVWDLVTGRARNMARKAEKMGVHVVPAAPLEHFWPLMEETFSHHGTTPTHSRAEIADLLQRLPDRLALDVAYRDGVPVAGAAMFVVNARVATSFYLCQNDAGRESEALSILIMDVLDRCRRKAFSYFDFGTSSHHMVARPGIFRFKESFGAVGQFRETLEFACG